MGEALEREGLDEIFFVGNSPEQKGGLFIVNRKYKHLPEEERIEIDDYLHNCVSFKDIGKRIGKDQTNVSKEVKKYSIVQKY